MLRDLVQEACSPSDPAWSALATNCRLLEEEDKRLVRELKLTLRAGIQVFERFERDSPTRGSDALLAVLRRTPEVLGAFYQHVHAGVQLIGANVGA